MQGLRANTLTVSLGRRRIIEDLSIELSKPGIAYGLVGINGAGKTTLMKALAGVRRPVKGRVIIDGQDLYRRRSRHRATLRKVALMPQRVNLPGMVTAHELVSHLSWLRGMNRADAVAASRRSLERVCLGEVSDVRLSRLSGGMLRRVILAQALASQAPVILLDEPSAGLDPEQRRIMVDILGEIDDSIILMSSHMMMDIQEVTQETFVIHRGSIIHDGPTGDLSRHDVQDPKTLEGGFLSLIGRRSR